MSYRELSINGLWKNNPAIVQLLGLCPLLAVSGSVVNAIGLGIATTLVLVCSNTAVSLIRNVVSEAVRLPAVPAEARDRGDDQARVPLAQYGGPDAEAVEGAGREVLDDDVALVHELEEERAAGVALAKSPGAGCAIATGVALGGPRSWHWAMRR